MYAILGFRLIFPFFLSPKLNRLQIHSRTKFPRRLISPSFTHRRAPVPICSLHSLRRFNSCGRFVICVFHLDPRSVNEVICHGIPHARKLEDDDIVNVDVIVFYKGVHGDPNETFFVGNVDEASQRLVQCIYECLEKVISIATQKIGNAPSRKDWRGRVI